MPSVKNADIAGLHSRVLDFKNELIKSQSSGLRSFQEADVARLKSYLAACKAYKAWITSQPVLDLPKTHPRPVSLRDNPEVVTENAAVTDCLRMLDAMATELAGSQSADLSSSLVSHDGKRFDDICTKLETYLTDFVETQHPIDMPESATSPDS